MSGVNGGGTGGVCGTGGVLGTGGVRGTGGVLGTGGVKVGGLGEGGTAALESIL